MKSSEIVNFVLNKNITQQKLAYYLDVSRQTIAKMKESTYVKLSEKSIKKLQNLKNRSEEELKKILDIDKNLDELKARIFEGDSSYIDFAYEGISYMHYWIYDEKFISQEKYHKYYYAHMNNFYPRFNQAALFMRDTLNRQKYPLVTFQIDYKRNKITNFTIKAFKNIYHDELYNTNKIEFPITFSEFLEELVKRIKPVPRFLIYCDYKDDGWKFILDNVKAHKIKELEIFDLSRLVNYFENQQNYYGPLIEDALEQFNIDFELKKLLSDCDFRARKIIELINMISLEKLHQKKHDKTSLMFDSHGFRRDNKYLESERRKLKKG